MILLALNILFFKKKLHLKLWLTSSDEKREKKKLEERIKNTIRKKN